MYLTRLCSPNVFLIFRSPFLLYTAQHTICNNHHSIFGPRKDQMRMFGKRFCFIAYNNNNNKADEMVEIRFGNSPTTTLQCIVSYADDEYRVFGNKCLFVGVWLLLFLLLLFTRFVVVLLNCLSQAWTSW